MRRSFGKILIGIVVFGLCLGAAFGAGTVYGRHSTTNAASAAESPSSRAEATVASTTTAGSATAANTSDATPGSGTRGRGGFAFGGGLGNRPIQGTVASISAQQLGVSIGTNGATTTTLALNAQTIYAMAQTAAQSALKSGDDVDVTTTTAGDGTLSAKSVIVVPKLPAPAAVAATPRASGASGPAGTGGFGGSGGRSFGGGGAATRSIDGTIASVSGNQLSVTLANGSSTTVTLSGQTTYQTTETADQSAVTNGASVLVTISRGSDGTLSATSVIVLPKTS
jgi:hypothetical protein